MVDSVIPFKRGTTFNYILKLPPDVKDGFLASWVPTAQVRRARHDTASGLVANMVCSWVDETAKQLLIHHNDTDQWPLGDAELDVLFTSPTQQTLRSKTLLIQVQRGITR